MRFTLRLQNVSTGLLNKPLQDALWEFNGQRAQSPTFVKDFSRTVRALGEALQAAGAGSPERDELERLLLALRGEAIDLLRTETAEGFGRDLGAVLKQLNALLPVQDATLSISPTVDGYDEKRRASLLSLHFQHGFHETGTVHFAVNDQGLAVLDQKGVTVVGWNFVDGYPLFSKPRGGAGSGETWSKSKVVMTVLDSDGRREQLVLTTDSPWGEPLADENLSVADYL